MASVTIPGKLNLIPNGNIHLSFYKGGIIGLFGGGYL